MSDPITKTTVTTPTTAAPIVKGVRFASDHAVPAIASTEPPPINVLTKPKYDVTDIDKTFGQTIPTVPTGPTTSTTPAVPTSPTPPASVLAASTPIVDKAKRKMENIDPGEGTSEKRTKTLLEQFDEALPEPLP